MTGTLRNSAAGDAATAVRIAPISVLKWLMVIIALLGLAHMLAMPVHVHGMKASEGVYVRVARFFMLQSERSIPTWYSIALITFNIVLLSVNATVCRQTRSGPVLPWVALVGLFVFLSIDEMLSLHERIGSAIGTRFHIGGDGAGFLTFPWVIAGVIFTVAVGVSFIGFLRSLPPRTARLFLLAGGIYVGGALVMEIVEAGTVSEAGMGALYYIEVLIEETMEMAGQALFAFALLDLLARSRITLVIAPPAAALAALTPGRFAGDEGAVASGGWAGE